MPEMPSGPRGGRGRGESGVLETTITEALLVNAYNEMRSVNGGATGYPDVHNPQAFVEGFRGFFEATAQSLGTPVPKELRLNVIEKSNKSGDPNAADYMLVIDDVTGANDGAAAYAVLMVSRQTMELESASVIASDGVTWSAENMADTINPKRTMYYFGFIALMAKRSPGYDRDQEPEDELSINELMDDVADMNAIPRELITLDDNDLDGLENIADDGYDNDTVDGAGFDHGSLTAEQSNELSSQVIDDIKTEFSDDGYDSIDFSEIFSNS